MNTAGAAADIFEPLFAGARAEKLCVACLDESQALLAVTEHDQGSGRAGVDLPLRAIVEQALRLGAAAVVLAHNHPSGNAEPSEADRESTRLLAEVLSRVGVTLQDHLIFAGGRWSSFRGRGLL